MLISNKVKNHIKASFLTAYAPLATLVSQEKYFSAFDSSLSNFQFTQDEEIVGKIMKIIGERRTLMDYNRVILDRFASLNDTRPESRNPECSLLSSYNVNCENHPDISDYIDTGYSSALYELFNTHNYNKILMSKSNITVSADSSQLYKNMKVAENIIQYDK